MAQDVLAGLVRTGVVADSDRHRFLENAITRGAVFISQTDEPCSVRSSQIAFHRTSHSRKDHASIVYRLYRR